MTSSKSSELNTALLIDGENISSVMADKLLSVARRFGDVVINRVYGNFGNLKGWSTVAGVRIVHSGSGKNAADIVLALDAVELSYERKVDVFVLASSDGDFVHVATRLRERGFTVVGLGENKAPDSFRQACSQWVSIEAESVSKPSVSACSAPQKNTNSVITFKNGAMHSEIVPQMTPSSAKVSSATPSFDEEVLRIVGENSQGITTSDINKSIRAIGAGKISEQVQKTWASYFKARKELFQVDTSVSPHVIRAKLKAQMEDVHKKIWSEVQKHQSGILISQANPILNGRLGVALSDLEEKSWRKYFEKRSDSFKISGEAQQTRITAR